MLLLTRRGVLVEEEGSTYLADSDADSDDARPQAKPQESRRIKAIERNLLRKDQALAETLALRVLSKKVGAIFNKGEDA